jgi:hypothetical protein
MHVLALSAAIKAADRGAATRRIRQADQHADCRALSGAIRPQQTKYLPLRDTKRNSVNSCE